MFWNKKSKTAVLDEQLVQALRTVNDPELHRDLVSLGMVKHAELAGKIAFLTIELTTPACPLKDTIRGDVEAAIGRVAPDAKVEIEWTAQVRDGRHAGGGGGVQELEGMKDVANVILVASGKGGVGKSTVATNLAAALLRTGARVGLLDADIYGPSIPTMLGLHQDVTSTDGKMIDPLLKDGLLAMSMGFFIGPDRPMIWRGPMLHSACLQFLRDVRWGALDYLVVDLPPGTGDVQLTFSQALKVSGAVIVSTPQAVALADVVRAKAMFDHVDIPILGLIENMAYFVCDGCDKRHAIFDTGGARKAAAGMGIPFLGELPIEAGVRIAGDTGMPVVQAEPESPIARAFVAIARELAGRISVANAEAEARAAAAPPPPVSGAGARRLPVIG